MIKITLNIIILFLFINNSHARTSTIDDKKICEKTQGVWREFGNNCGDDCTSKTKFSTICNNNITFKCDCGTERCWDQDRCILQTSYEERIKEEEQKKLLEEQLIENPEIEQKICERESGTYKEFSNQCANYCSNILTLEMSCIKEPIKSCDCKNDKCWHENRCILKVDYLKNNLIKSE